MATGLQFYGQICRLRQILVQAGQVDGHSWELAGALKAVSHQVVLQVVGLSGRPCPPEQRDVARSRLGDDGLDRRIDSIMN